MTATDLGLPRGDAFDPGPPTEEQMAEQEAILAEQLSAGGPGPAPDELLGFLPDPDTGPPEGEDAWLGDLPSPLLADVLAGQAAGQPGEGAAGPGRRDHPRRPRPGRAGFASGSVLDALAPGPVPARALDDTWTAGLERLSDDGLACVMLAFRRPESRGAAGLLAAASELDRRRPRRRPPAGGEGRSRRPGGADRRAFRRLRMAAATPSPGVYPT